MRLSSTCLNQPSGRGADMTCNNKFERLDLSRRKIQTRRPINNPVLTARNVISRNHLSEAKWVRETVFILAARRAGSARQDRDCSASPQNPQSPDGPLWLHAGALFTRQHQRERRHRLLRLTPISPHSPPDTPSPLSEPNPTTQKEYNHASL